VLNHINLTSEEISKKILNANKQVLFNAAGLTDEITLTNTQKEAVNA